MLDSEDKKIFQNKDRFPQHPVQCAIPVGPAKNSRRLGEAVAHAAAEKACEHWMDMKEQQCVLTSWLVGILSLALPLPLFDDAYHCFGCSFSVGVSFL